MRRVFWLTAIVAAALSISVGVETPAADADGARIDVIVRAHPGAVDAARSVVVATGGRIERELRVVDGFAASIPTRALPKLRSDRRIVGVTPDARVRLLGKPSGGNSTLGYDAQNDKGSLLNVAKMTRATDSWSAGYTGKGVDVALIDSGVVPVQGLTSGNVILGPDLSFESQSADRRNLDTFGHGTHMASIIAGRDRSGTAAEYASGEIFTGIAPDARVVSIKVAAHDGAVDVSQVIAAIDWVVQHRNKHGLNIRVLNLSFGTDSTQDPAVDPLSYAVDVAMQSDVLVVAAMGNDGHAEKRMANPAHTPSVVAVGGLETRGTASTTDDEAPSWATKGNNMRGADLGAPGVSVIGLRVPGSTIDTQYPGARVADRFFRGSGSSQATAVVSGAAALLVQRYPTLSAYSLKEQLRAYAQAEPYISSSFVGKGLVDAFGAIRGKLVKEKVYTLGTGNGLLEGARGSAHVAIGGVELVGEQDIMGKPFVSTFWAPSALAGTTWTGGTWNGTTWTGTTWTTDAWFGSSWAGTTWTGTTWTGTTWTGTTWTGTTWTGTTWTGISLGTTWTGTTWTNSVWAGGGWE